MGYFLTVSAFRSVSPLNLALEIEEYLGHYGVVRSRFSGARGGGEAHWPAYSERTDLCIFSPIGDWALVLWPEYFTSYDVPMCRSLSQSLDTLVSTIHTFDSDYWVHHLFRQGDLLDRFCSWPTYFASGTGDEVRLHAGWSGNSEIVTIVFGVPSSIIAPYFTHQDLKGARRDKAHPDDTFPLQNFWVFTDFWQRLGIVYQSDVDAAEVRIRLDSDFLSKIPTTEGSEL